MERYALALRAPRGPYRPFTAPAPSEAAHVDALLERVGLAHVAHATSRSLSHGARRQLELGLALALRPRVLLLDEPTAGMSPAETARIVALLAALERTITLVVVEHDMDVVFRIAERITVLHEGRVIAAGTPAEVRADAQVNEVYLGKVVS